MYNQDKLQPTGELQDASKDVGGKAMLKLSLRTIPILVIATCMLASPASSGDLVRVDFTTEDFNSSDCNVHGGVYGELCQTDDDYFDCDPGAPVDPFDLLDIEDDDNACDPPPSTDGVIQSDVSGGGRWKLATIGGDPPDLSPERTVAIHFTGTADNDPGVCARLPILGDGIDPGTDLCGCDTLCFVQARMSADRAFKKGATRQAFSITVIRYGGETDPFWRPSVNINYIDPLYICPGFDKDSRYLQTAPCPGMAGAPAQEAEICVGGSPGCSDSRGRWNLPAQIFLEKTPRAGDGGGDPGGGCVPGSGQKKDPCTQDSDCSSCSCRGKSGAKTCK